MKNTDLRLQQEARWLKALASVTRLRIIEELLGHEKCVSDIRDLLEARQANISQHLAILNWSGIVGCRQDGKRRCYYLKDPKLVAEFLSLARKMRRRT